MIKVRNMQTKRNSLTVGRGLLLAAPVLAAQLLLSQTDLGAVSGFNAALAQEAQPKKEQETRRTPALRNKVYEKLAEAQAAAEAKDMAGAAKILDAMLAGRRDNELNSYELANVYNLYATQFMNSMDRTVCLQIILEIIWSVASMSEKGMYLSCIA